MTTFVISWPNTMCRELTLQVSIGDYKQMITGGIEYSDPREEWQLIPRANIKVFPDYVPAPIIADYREAALVSDLSPKAAATLARRCLQGMVRDFWAVSKARLVDEIDAIEDRVDPSTWRAIDAVRSIGNIGAHMEKDINLIVDVDPGEAAVLISLIETLITDWYIARHEREERMKQVVTIADAKKAERKGESQSP